MKIIKSIESVAMKNKDELGRCLLHGEAMTVRQLPQIDTLCCQQKEMEHKEEQMYFK